MKELLLKRALEVLPNAYAPYSNFHVAAALECADGSIYTGVNAENAAYGSTICAERSAFLAAIGCGKREFKRILIIGGTKGEVNHDCPPCGACRQFMSEFCDDDFEIILYNGERFVSQRLAALLPGRFQL